MTITAIRDLLQANLTKATIAAAANDNAIAVTGYSLTGADATSMIDLAGTWNTTGTPTALKLNITKTASNASSMLMDLQVDGATLFGVVASDGDIILKPFATIRTNDGDNDNNLQSTGSGWRFNNQVEIVAGSGAHIVTSNVGAYSWKSTTAVTSGSRDLSLYRDAGGILAQRSGTAAQEFRVYNTYTDASNLEYGGFKWNANVFEVGMAALGTGSNRDIEIKTPGVGKFIKLSVASDGVKLTAAAFASQGNGVKTLGAQSFGWKSLYLTATNVDQGNNSNDASIWHSDGTDTGGDGDLVFSSHNGTNTCLRILPHNGATTEFIPISDGTTGGASSAGAGNQYVELNINGVVYRVLHDGFIGDGGSPL
jgi:hypothetical protein